MYYRRNIDCLSADELHALREALAALFAASPSDPFSFATLASFHGGPPVSYCAHGAPGFFTWHRAYLLAFENALRVHGCGVSLPYWDWSSGPSTGVPAACRDATYVNRSGAAVPNPLYSGPRAAGGQTSRRSNIDTTAFDDLATAAQTAMSATSFSSFQNQMNGVHGSVHVRTGGDMASVPTAAYDPIFYLHHANIDRLWANWQAAHPGALPASEASFELQPFNRPYSTSWYTGAEMESTAALGYGYRNFCFFLPPFRLWEVVKFRLRPELAQRVPALRVVLKSHHMQPEPMEIRVFVNQPDASAKTETVGNRQLAGIGAFFAHGPANPHAQHGDASKAAGDEHGEHRPPPQPGAKERFDLEIDITRAVREASAKSEELTLKLVAVDANGKEVPTDRALLEQIELTLE
jgi:tyrosinase